MQKNNLPDVIYVEHSADEWVNGKYIPLYEGGTQWDGNKTEYHHSRIVEALKAENEELKAKLEKAKDALNFYAYCQGGSGNIGHRARTTLEGIE